MVEGIYKSILIEFKPEIQCYKLFKDLFNHHKLNNLCASVNHDANSLLKQDNKLDYACKMLCGNFFSRKKELLS